MNVMTWIRSEWDRVVGFALVILGALFLFLGYQGVKDTPFVAEELAYIASGGLGGLFCLGLGVGLLLSADLHDEWRKLDRIEAALRGEPLPDVSRVEELVVKSNGAGATVAPGVARGVASARGALAMAIDWKGEQLRRAMGVATLAVVAPAAVMTAGWRRAHATADLDVATRGLGIAVLGLFLALAIIGIYGLWLRVRVTGRKMTLFGVQLLEDDLAERRRLQPPRPSAVGRRAEVAGPVLVAPGLRRFHLGHCPMLSGVAAGPVSRSEVDPGLEGCDVCGAR